MQRQANLQEFIDQTEDKIQAMQQVIKDQQYELVELVAINALLARAVGELDAGIATRLYNTFSDLHQKSPERKHFAKMVAALEPVLGARPATTRRKN